MSSLHCKNCHERIWDKYLGMSKGCKWVVVNGWIFKPCGFCNDLEIEKDF
jgi:hypothetical protein